MKPMKSRYSRGYTLIELMMVLGIIGVLASWAVPEYFDYVRDSRRADAISSMNRMLAQQELFYANNNSVYTDQVLDLGYPNTLGNSIAPSGEGFYTITMAACGSGLGSCIAVSASPVAGTSQAQDTDCFTIAINSQGRQTAQKSDSTSNNEECWN
ncbi:MAG: type IV pilin protein [bacterium]